MCMSHSEYHPIPTSTRQVLLSCALLRTVHFDACCAAFCVTVWWTWMVLRLVPKRVIITVNCILCNHFRCYVWPPLICPVDNKLSMTKCISPLYITYTRLHTHTHTHSHVPTHKNTTHILMHIHPHALTCAHTQKHHTHTHAHTPTCTHMCPHTKTPHTTHTHDTCIRMHTQSCGIQSGTLWLLVYWWHVMRY